MQFELKRMALQLSLCYSFRVGKHEEGFKFVLERASEMSWIACVTERVKPKALLPSLPLPCTFKGDAQPGHDQHL